MQWCYNNINQRIYEYKIIELGYQSQSPTQFNYATEIVIQVIYNYSPHWRSVVIRLR